MKLVASIALVLVFGLAGAQSGAQKAPKKPKPVQKPSVEKTILKSDKDIESYVLGIQAARNFEREQFEVDTAMFIKGFMDQVNGKKLPVTEDQIRGTVSAVLAQMRMRNRVATRTLPDMYLKQQVQFLNENKKKPGVVSMPSGLQYKVIKQGDGKKPSYGDSVVVNYKGTTVDGEVFDSSDKLGHPAVFNLKDLILGWREGLMMMPTGSHYMLYVPAPLGYGAESFGKVRGNSVLIFDVELIAVR